MYTFAFLLTLSSMCGLSDVSWKTVVFTLIKYSQECVEVNGIHSFLMLAYKYKYALFSAYKHIIQISEHNRTEPFPSFQQ